MRIGIDARQISHPKRHGLRTYVENLVLALSKVDEKNEYVLYLDAKETFNLDSLGLNYSIKILPWRIKYGSTLLNDYFNLPLHTAVDKIDVMHYPAYPANLFNAVKTVITVHDALPFIALRDSIIKHGIKKFIYHRLLVILIRLSSKIASGVITISNKSMDDLVRIAGLNAKKINVIYEAANNNFRNIENENQIKEIKQKYNLGNRFILGFSHKNGTRIVEAYDRLSDDFKTKYRVALICQSTEFSDEIKRIIDQRKLKNRIVHIPPVSEKDLVLIYNAASLFVFPSFYEGFGLPVLEAMQCGCPVICSIRGSLTEIAGDAAIFVNEIDDMHACAKELAEKMEKILIDSKLRKDLIKKGFNQANKFSWDNAARETLKIYEKIYRINK